MSPEIMRGVSFLEAFCQMRSWPANKITCQTVFFVLALIIILYFISCLEQTLDVFSGLLLCESELWSSWNAEFFQENIHPWWGLSKHRSRSKPLQSQRQRGSYSAKEKCVHLSEAGSYVSCCLEIFIWYSWSNKVLSIFILMLV